MTAREIREALRDGTHVIARFPGEPFGCRVFDAREHNGALEVKIATGWRVANGATVYEA